ncbi:MAG TPA: nucleotidyltransferase family protein [Vicinamibacteria bacterium]|nr:nucleotidyltransferase family protein [Vicinamibacteria bacterium]
MGRPAERGARVAVVLAGSWRAAPPLLDVSARDLIDVAPLLLQTGAASLGWWKVRRSPVASCTAAKELHDAYRLFALQAVLHEQRVAKAFAALRAAGVEAILGKGWAIARQYPDPGLRPYGDVDLYVRPAQHAAAVAALEDPPREGIDLHRGLAQLDDRPADEVFARSRVESLHGVEVRVFGAEDHIRLLALHMLRHGVLRPLWLCDVALALESRPPDFDWRVFASGSRRRLAWVRSAFALAHALLGARLDGVPMPEGAARPPRWLVPAVLRQWSAFVPPHGSRAPMAASLRHPAAFVRGLLLRWPNPVEATVGVGGPFNRMPRLPFQIGDCLLRTAQFARRLAVER